MAAITNILAFSAFFFIISTYEEVYAKENKSTFCCDIELPTKETKKLVYKPKKKSKFEERKFIAGYEKCGIVRDDVWCPIYDYVWEEVPYYVMAQVEEVTTINLPCPDEHLVCCKGYERFRDNCYKPDEIENLKKLESLGIFGSK